MAVGREILAQKAIRDAARFRDYGLSLNFKIA
jgi:hypothetical protein